MITHEQITVRKPDVSDELVKNQHIITEHTGQHNRSCNHCHLWHNVTHQPHSFVVCLLWMPEGCGTPIIHLLDPQTQRNWCGAWEGSGPCPMWYYSTPKMLDRQPRTIAPTKNWSGGLHSRASQALYRSHSHDMHLRLGHTGSDASLKNLLNHLHGLWEAWHCNEMCLG